MKHSFFLLFIACGLSAQTNLSKNVTIHFLPTFNDKVILFQEENKSLEEQDFQVETLKFYISTVELWNGETLAFAEKDSYHLLDAENRNSLSFHLDTPHDLPYSSIKFHLGIDSVTNVSGAFGGDLDPSNGMYWTWQSGYINFKLEGRATNCPARHHQFQYHIGGYQSPYSALQVIELEVFNRKDIKIELPIDKIFEVVNVADNYQTMRPSEEAIQFSELLKSLFSISK